MTSCTSSISASCSHVGRTYAAASTIAWLCFILSGWKDQISLGKRNDKNALQ
jgi:hypothetical protein